MDEKTEQRLPEIIRALGVRAAPESESLVDALEVAKLLGRDAVKFDLAKVSTRRNSMAGVSAPYSPWLNFFLTRPAVLRKLGFIMVTIFQIANPTAYATKAVRGVHLKKSSQPFGVAL